MPEHAADVRRCAEWTAAEMTRIGMQNVRLEGTPGYPVVYGDWLGAEGAPLEGVMIVKRRRREREMILWRLLVEEGQGV